MIEQNELLLAEKYKKLENELALKNRELEIEAALERVRASTMAMITSEEIGKIIYQLFSELKNLGIVHHLAQIITDFELNKDWFNTWYASDEKEYAHFVRYNFFDHPFNEKWKNALKNGISFYNVYYSKKEKDAWFDGLFRGSDLSFVSEERKKMLYQTPGLTRIVSLAKNSSLSLMKYSNDEFSEEDKNIVVRFGNLFEQSYTRFLDLKRAEEQAREAQIEVALERVRSRSMGMYKSDELQEVVTLVFEQFYQLGIRIDSSVINIFEDNSRDFNMWISDGKGSYVQKIHMPYFNHPIFNSAVDAKAKGTDFVTKIFNKEETHSFMSKMVQTPDLQNVPEDRKKFLLSVPGYARSLAIGKYTAIAITNYDIARPFSDIENDILRRIAKVFEQTYTRFLDLQKAEAQAREAQIETALEKVRSRSLAMHKSDELQEVINNVYNRLNELDIKMDAVNIDIFQDSGREFDAWVASPRGNYSARIHIPDIGFGPSKVLMDARENGDEFCVYKCSFEEKNKWFNFVFEHTDFRHVPEDRKRYILEGKFWNVAFAIFRNSAMQLNSYTLESFSERDISILQRFGKVFEQAYIRFLDLQKAEAQAREAQIETALEKVRSRSLAMHKSDELQEVITTVLQRLNELGIAMDSAVVVLPLVDKNAFVGWIATNDFTYSQGFRIPLGLNSVIAIDMERSYNSGSDYYTKQYSKEEKDEYYKDLFEHSSFRHISQDRKDFLFGTGEYGVSIARNKNSGIHTLSYSGKTLNSEEIEILKRFSRVFEQAYIRFLDLQKAEAQAREAQIEASLERVRSRTMGMQKSEELAEVIAQISTEITNLGIRSDNTAIMTEMNLTENSGSACMWMSIPGKTYSNKFYIPPIQHPVMYRVNEAFKKKKELYTEIYSKEEKNKYFKIAFEESDLKLIPEARKEVLLNAPAWTRTVTLQKNSGLIISRFNDEVFSDEENAVAIRFGRVFEQTYTRFLDLQKTEQQLREAIKQASLDRVRGEIASMRTKDDLDRITPLIWKELIALGVPFIRCGVFIMDEEKNEIHTYLSTPDGHAIAAFHTPLDDSGPLNDAIDNWRIKKKYMAHWVEKDFSLQADVLVLHGAITTRDQYLNSIPKAGFYLHFSPFLQGMIYVGSMVSLQPDDFQLVQSLADAFSVAYARYEDFKQLEEAKLQTEKTLNELKDTQKQLIQSEKMASLGELTAGIAHEIQNPLNFVNNFSEVSNELIVEIEEEMAKNPESRDENQVSGILSDIKQNLIKINHHGKRAADIVKGMLQHSRTSSGVKEPTDINALTDEFLRLTYHGLKAKDKSFNAEFKTDFDPTLPKINVIPQDIGRVLLNLINNAFYAVDNRAKSIDPLPPKGGSEERGIEYKPTVIVRTTSSKSPLGDLGVKITVKDNGDGISKNIVDKIFQPFFTTKPTGEGTGLGLSLSYDIVKAHGGELKVETKEGVGSEFIIQIPIN